MFTVKEAPEGKYRPQVTLSSSTDSAASVKEIAKGGQAYEYQLDSTEVSEDGKIQTDAVESPISSREQLLQRLQEAEEQSRKELEDLYGLDEAAERERQKVLGQMEGTSQATEEQSADEAPESQQTSPGKRKLDEIEAEQPGMTELCTAVAQQLPPGLLNLLDKSPFGADVLSELALHPAGLQQILQFSPHEQAAMLTSRMWQLQKESKERQTQAVNQKAAGARQRLKPTPAVGGNVRAAVPLDEMDYQTYRKIRDEQSKGRYRR